MGKSTRAEISALVLSLQSAQRWNEGGTLLFTHKDGVSVHRYEVQRRGSWQVGAAL